jgi:hypothetical protein
MDIEGTRKNSRSAPIELYYFLEAIYLLMNVGTGKVQNTGKPTKKYFDLILYHAISALESRNR